MSWLKTVWAWISRTESQEEIYKKALAEYELHIGRISQLDKDLEEYRKQATYALAKQMVENFREMRDKQRKTPLTALEMMFLRELTPKSECTHTKGGNMVPLGYPHEVGRRPMRWVMDKFRGSKVAADYNLANHRFSDGTQKIWCLNGCGWSASPGSENWKEALKMWKTTSNRATSSEIIARTLMPGFDPNKRDGGKTIKTTNDPLPTANEGNK